RPGPGAGCPRGRRPPPARLPDADRGRRVRRRRGRSGRAGRRPGRRAPSVRVRRQPPEGRGPERGADRGGPVPRRVVTCVFCAIVAGEAPAERVFSDDLTLAFLDVNPAADGHTLVVPKRHVENLLELQDPDAGVVWTTVRHVANVIRDALRPDGLNL